MSTVLTYTDAPASFDGFGTRTVRVVGTISTHMGPRPVRLVETPTEHAEWQRSRYGSGSYLSADEAQWPRVASLVTLT